MKIMWILILAIDLFPTTGNLGHPVMWHTFEAIIYLTNQTLGVDNA